MRYGPKRPFPQRQIHLDFHTSNLIPGIGSAFNAAEFADTFAAAHVDSVTVFAVCHHGMAYYPSKVAPVHPHLKFDLLGAQIEALHRRNIRCPIYITVAWNYHEYNKHPEWWMVDRHGNAYHSSAPGFYGYLQWVEGAYVEHLQAVVADVLKQYGKEVDGFFFDIVMLPTSDGGPFDEISRDIRAAKGWLEPTLENAVRFEAHARETFARRMNAFIAKHNKNCSVFYNNAHGHRIEPSVGLRGEAAYQSQMEMESLPSGGWGYFHFPRFARATQALGLPGLGMTGKFHKTWGDFGGRKNRAALEFECFRSQALGFANSIGDQLHPTGAICKSTYQLVGQVYAGTQAAEPFYEGTAPVPQVGILSPGAAWLDAGMTALSEDGASSMLEEMHYECQILDAEADLSHYDCLILPDSAVVDARLARKINAYGKAGGALILSGSSGLDRDGKLHLTNVPFEYQGPEPLYPTFLRYPAEAAGDGRLPMDEAMYEAGYNWKPGKGAKVVVERVVPYFARRANHFCSHYHTPPAAPSKYPAAARANRVFLFGDPVFRAYRKHGAQIYRLMVRHALRELIGPPVFGDGLPESVLLTVRRKGRDARLSLLHYIPVRKATEIDIIERPQPLGGLEVRMRLESKPASVKVHPNGEALELINTGRGEWAVRLPNDSMGRVLLTVENAYK